ncbi:unnamed protein product [Adineta steineri]|uniref:G-protein coupled receptors family 1 profile domain-containing protein n=1 Tax=Adineta steineri TaxID=433720 RepID=A0A815EUB1_9BILA|nr:unnamed protein product [Adineta steineri]CAF1582184.1 unnamed protein product [Adineta steineri]
MNSTTVESWFIPLDIIAIICLALTIALATIALIIIIMDKTCHTVPMLLTANICLTGLLCGIDTIGMNGFTLYNDLKQIEYEDSFCFIIGFFNYSTCALHNYSYVTSAIYRYITIVHPTRLFWQSARAQIILIVRFVRGMSQRVTAANTLSRAQRDLKMVRRVVTLVQILFISGFPLSLFIFLSFFNHAPKYHFRIGFLFVNASMLLVKITLFQFTDPLKVAIKKILRRRLNIVLPIPAITRSLT